MPDLHTNLILNDKQFNDGLRRAEGGLSAFTSKVKGFSGGLRTALGVAGLATTIGAVVDTYAKIHDAQIRINAGVASFEDHWVASRGAFSNFMAELPVLGQFLDKIDRSMGGFEESAIQFRGREEAKAYTQAIRDRLELARAETSEEKELVRLKQEDRKGLADLNRLSKMTGDNYDKQRDALWEILTLGRQRVNDAREQAELEKSIADYTKQQAEAKAQRQSGDSFYDMVEREQISKLRQFGLDDEADRRSRELERQQRIRDIQNDPTVNTRDPEMMRRLQIVDLLSLLDAEKKAMDEASQRQTVSVGQVGSASVLGQVFAPGAMNDQRREQKRLGDTAEKILTQLNRLVARRDNPSVYN